MDNELINPKPLESESNSLEARSKILNLIDILQGEDIVTSTLAELTEILGSPNSENNNEYIWNINITLWDGYIILWDGYIILDKK